MAEHKTHEQVREEHNEVLGPILGPLYHGLYEEVTWLHAKWKQYRILFAESPERIELLNQVAGFFFRVIQDVLWEDVVLHIARLTDPPRSNGKNNLTLFRLEGAVPQHALSVEVATLVQRARLAAEFARVWRNRRLAHRDLSLVIGNDVTPLPGISRAEVENALDGIRAVLNKIESHFFQSEAAFQEFSASDDAESLACYLKLAVDAERRERESLLRRCRAPNPTLSDP